MIQDDAAVFYCDLDWVISVWTPGAEYVFGIAADDAVGRTTFDLFDTPNADRLERVAALEATGDLRSALTYQRPDGDVVELEGNTVALYSSDDGEAAGYLLRLAPARAMTRRRRRPVIRSVAL